LDDFDSFYGYQDFGGVGQETVSQFSSVVQEEELECHSTSITIIQQQLAVIREYVKKLISVQICEVEVQTIVVTQFRYGLYGFDQDIRHRSGRRVGFDNSIARRIGDLHDETSDISSENMNFSGYAVGDDMVWPCGGNWDSDTSPSSVDAAYNASLSAADLSAPPLDQTSNTTSDCSAACNSTTPATSTNGLVSDDTSSNTTDTSADADTAAVPAETSTADSSSSNPNPASD